ncbi:TM2 domain-containing membrane protein YozV [Planomicrobium stackebrandtii]|uniref:TM2 domain-containing membrane protein YozV n=1 Tax=Planomicrobium stackebrandtii TaxID=253160 RepID=A0ABU0GUP6_9BACL|nr:TM2 domain-containing protein [Planomicrobium stackebrandtii]MDQ0428511.1 TM2 domain-containing membrane protein YozV [Planomicrobium stackebrandtii]
MTTFNSSIQSKQGLTSEQLLIIQQEMETKSKKPLVAYLLWFFLGTLGAHRFYLGNTGMAICMILFGWLTLFIWPLIDVFFIGGRIRAVNERIETNAINQVKSFN